MALIHCLTNKISINDAANAILAVGDSPIMAEHPSEVAEIAENASCIYLNIGNISDIMMEAILKVCNTAVEKNIPIVFDPVGVGCSSLRRAFANKILDIVANKIPLVIKGNKSEILSLYTGKGSAIGVDTDDDYIIQALKSDINVGGITIPTSHIEELSMRYNAVIVMTGETDIVATKGDIYLISGGSPMLSKLTGTGCMLGAIISAYIGDEMEVSKKSICSYADYNNSRENMAEVEDSYYGNARFEEAVKSAVKDFKDAGKRAAQKSAGSGSLRVNIIDELYKLHN